MAVTRRIIALALASAGVAAGAAELPDDRSEAMFHSYSGGGVEVTGPALLVRKGFAEKFSVSAGYYVDSISSASIDVMTNASPYSEERKQLNLGLDYLTGDTLMSLSVSDSDENDYQASTVNFDVSQDVFGGLTTVSVGFSRGDDDVGRVDLDFAREVDRFQYRAGLSQVITQTFIASLDYEAIIEEGFLNNPYRAARVYPSGTPGLPNVLERYPGTRSSSAVALKTRKFWRHGGASRVDYRYFADSWDLVAHTVELGYKHRFGERWTADFHYRYYSQDAASFYADNFLEEFNYMARDKELSTFASHTVGTRVGFLLFDSPTGRLARGTVHLGYDLVTADYDDYTDARTNELYSFESHVLQIYFSLFY